MDTSILVSDKGDWVEITLNRPDRLNSFTTSMHAQLRTALTGAKSKRAVLLTGAGRAFCAGQDLGDRNPQSADWPPDLSASIQENWAPLVRLIRGLDMPVICAVNGVAAGAGASLALNCDIVLAATSARFIQSFSKVGLIPDTGGSWQLTRHLGPARAKALALLAEPMSAEQAADWGLIWKTLADDALLLEARALAERLAAGPTLGFALTKRAIDAASSNSLEAQLALEAELAGICGQSHDYAEGVSAFLEKRDPKFLGR